MASSDVGQVVLCTGANRGLGLCIIQATALRLPSATYLLGSRSLKIGREAAEELKLFGIKSSIKVIELDVTSDSSILAAVERVKLDYGKLDVLINNAGIARIPNSLSDSLSDFRSSYDSTFSTNVTSVAMLTTSFLPLLHASPAPKVINISSARGSLTRSTEGRLPPTAAVAYSVSKTALNALTIEFQKAENARRIGAGGRIRFWAASPGHLRTAFNNFKGAKDPLDGAEVVVRLICEDETEGQARKGGTFWEFEGGEMREVPW